MTFTYPFGFRLVSGGVNAVAFDGSTTHLDKTTDLTGLTDGSTGLISVWINPFSWPAAGSFTAARYNVFACDFRPDNSDGGFELSLRQDATFGGGDKYFEIVGWDNTNSIILDLDTTHDVYDETSGWLHLLASWDVSSSTATFYVSDVDETIIDTLGGGEGSTIIDYTTSHADVGATNSGGARLYEGDMAELWFDTQYLDLSIASNRRKFIGADGKPVDLGDDGTEPGLGQPLVFLSGSTENWHINKGTGGGFTESGTLVTANTNPSD